jgi:hypothetical protein
VATRAPQVPTFNGGALTMHTAAAGDKVSGVTKPTRVLVHNGSGVSVTLTATVPGNTSYNVAAPDKTFTIAANSFYVLTLLPEYRDASDSYLVALGWSATTDVTWAVIG